MINQEFKTQGTKYEVLRNFGIFLGCWELWRLKVTSFRACVRNFCSVRTNRNMNMVQKHKWFGTHTSYFYDDLLRQIMDKNRIQMLLFVFLACFCFHIQISDDKIVSNNWHQQLLLQRILVAIPKILQLTVK